MPNASSGHALPDIALLRDRARDRPRPLAAQLFLGFGGVEARAGVADPKNGGSSATFEADLGYAGNPALRTTLGIDVFGSPLNHTIGGQQVGGTMSGAGGVAAVRYDISRAKRSRCTSRPAQPSTPFAPSLTIRRWPTASAAGMSACSSAQVSRGALGASTSGRPPPTCAA